MLETSTIRKILERATKAPSSHNTQPWLFRIEGECVRLVADRTRALPVNDPDDRELTISCGCALTNLRIAAAAQGLDCDVDHTPNADEGDELARIVLTEADSSDSRLAALSEAIETRRTCRKRFDKRSVSDSVLADLARATEAEGANLEIVRDENTRKAIAKLVAEGDRIQWDNPGWRRELAAWMHPRRKGDGLTVPGFAVPIAQLIVRSFDMGKGVAAKDSELAEHSPLLALLSTDEDDPKSWLNAGQALERLLLVAAEDGIQASYLNQPIQVAALRQKLSELAGVSGFPQILLRLGHPTEELPATPRRPLDDVLDD